MQSKKTKRDILVRLMQLDTRNCKDYIKLYLESFERKTQTKKDIIKALGN